MKKINVAHIGLFDINENDVAYNYILKKEFKNHDIDGNVIMFAPTSDTKRNIYSLDTLEDTIINKNIKAIIIGGGNVITLDKQISSLYEASYLAAIELWQMPILLANKYNIPVVFNAPGVPYDFLQEQREVIYSILSKVNYLNVKDEFSANKLQNIGLHNVTVVPDTLNAIDDAITIVNNKKLDEKYLMLEIDSSININSNKLLHIMEFIEFLIKENEYKIILVSKNKDLLKICKEKKYEQITYKSDFTFLDIKEMLPSINSYVGTNLTNLIIFNTYCVPIISLNINYCIDVRGFLYANNKKDIEVNDLEELVEVYKSPEYKEQDFSNNKNTKEQLLKHFNNILNIICSKPNNKCDDVYKYVLNNLYNNIEEAVLTNNERIKLQTDLNNILNSKSWRLFCKLNNVKKSFKNDQKHHEIIEDKSKKQLKSPGKIAIQIHVYYTALLSEIYQSLLLVPYNFDCYISTDTIEKKEEVISFFANKKVPFNLVIEQYENRGRDIMPFIIQLKNRINKYDYICHIHTKRSKHARYGSDWRKYLYYNLFGTTSNIESIFYILKTSKIGIVFPETYENVKQFVNLDKNNELYIYLCNKLKINGNILKDNFIFPAGSMFWAKKDALLPLFEELEVTDFPKESNQEDTTLAHAVERSFVVLPVNRGYDYIQTINETKNK